MVENSWDVELVADIFEHRDVNIILSILIDREVNDSWYWRKEKLGNYSVKSAYLILEEENNDAATSANSGFWRKIWNLKIPPKVKNFLWRACSNCLPTKDLLTAKRVPVNLYCSMCNEHQETVLHILVQCAYAVSTWSNFNKVHVVGEYNSFADWIHLAFEQYNMEEMTKAVMICWQLWKNRNDLI